MEKEEQQEEEEDQAEAREEEEEGKTGGVDYKRETSPGMRRISVTWR